MQRGAEMNLQRERGVKLTDLTTLFLIFQLPPLEAEGKSTRFWRLKKGVPDGKVILRYYQYL